MSDDQLNVFCHETAVYDATEYGVTTYDNLLGHHGFCITGRRGLAYCFADYYYIDNGKLFLLTSAANNVFPVDVDCDGSNELLWLYHGRMTLVYLADGKQYSVELADLIGEQTDWRWREADPPEILCGDMSQPATLMIPVTLCLADYNGPLVKTTN